MWFVTVFARRVRGVSRSEGASQGSYAPYARSSNARVGATKSTRLPSNSSVLIATPDLPAKVNFFVGMPLSTVNASDGALAAKAVRTGALASRQKLKTPVVRFTGRRRPVPSGLRCAA